MTQRLFSGNVRRASLAIALVLVLAVLIVPEAATAAEPIKWSFLSSIDIVDNPVINHWKQFTELVKQKTNGRLIITLRGTSELPFRPAEHVRVVRDRHVEVADANLGFVSGDLKIGPVTYLPFLARKRDELVKAMQIVGPHIEEELQKYNAATLFWYTWPEQQLWGAGKPVKTWTDLKGRKIRTISPEVGTFLTQIGGAPVTMPPGEVGPAFDRGVIEAVNTTALTVIPLKWDVYVKWGYLVNFGYNPAHVIVNRDALNSLPEDVRRGLVEAARETQAGWTATPTAEAGYVERLRQKGVVINTISDEDLNTAIRIMKPIWEEWAQKRGGKIPAVLAELRKALGK